MSLVKMKALLTKNFRLQPSEVDRMPMWEYELFVNCLNDVVKEENDKQKNEMDKYHVDEYMKAANPKNIERMTQSPKTPSMPTSINFPK